MVSIDGLYYDKDFSAKSPSLFLIGNEPHREQTFAAMEDVMWSNNLGKKDFLNILNIGSLKFIILFIALWIERLFRK